MKEYGRRHRPVLPMLSRGRKPLIAQTETELTLHLGKMELFDRHVLLPHAEVSGVVYSAVNQFVERYEGDALTLTILCEQISEALQNTFREVYVSHYEDEYRKLSRYLERRYIRVAVLLAISVAAYFGGHFFSRFTQNDNFLVNVISNVGVFCLWEIGYTHFDRSDAAAERRRVARARDALIQFQ